SRHTRCYRDWSSDVCSSDLGILAARAAFASVIPGSKNRVWVLPAIGAAVWSVSLLWAGVRDLQASGTLGVTTHSDWPCVVSMARSDERRVGKEWIVGGLCYA